MKTKSRFILIFCLILICSSLAATAFSAPYSDQEVSISVLYSDVPVSYSYADSYAEDIIYLTEAGITNGCGGGKFEPDRILTAGEFFTLLVRAFGDENDLGNPVEACLNHHWEKRADLYASSAPIMRQTLYEGIFNAAGIAVYNPGLFGGDYVSRSETYVYAARELGLCDASASRADYITRGEAAYVFHQVLTQEYELDQPEIANLIGLEFELEFLPEVSELLCRIDLLPDWILEDFHEQGWKLVFGDDCINDYDEQNQTSSIGLTWHTRKTIYGSTPDAVLHEFGHFVYRNSGADMIEQVEQYFESEKEAAGEIISEYAMQNVSEFFAEYFEFFILHQGNSFYMNELQEDTPLMFEYMLQLVETH